MRERHTRGDVDAACEALGWLNLTMCAREIGAPDPDIDFHIGYALALGVRPEFAEKVKLPMHPRVEKLIDWWTPLETPDNHRVGQLPFETFLTSIRVLIRA